MVVNGKAGFLRHQTRDHLYEVTRLIGYHQLDRVRAAFVPSVLDVAQKVFLQLMLYALGLAGITGTKPSGFIADQPFWFRIFGVSHWHA